jgi:hypothetical protein
LGLPAPGKKPRGIGECAHRAIVIVQIGAS